VTDANLRRRFRGARRIGIARFARVEGDHLTHDVPVERGLASGLQSRKARVTGRLWHDEAAC
jgi:hypothetical protein